MPAASAASSSVSVPVTFTSTKAWREWLSTCGLCSVAVWMTAVTPAIAPRTNSGSVIEPTRVVNGEASRSSPRAGRPAACRLRISASPRCPALPVIRIVMAASGRLPYQAAVPAHSADFRGRSRMTWSIVAYDQAAGAFGAAVATKAFAAGTFVPFVQSGVGAVGTQSLTNRYLGPAVLSGLARGLSAQLAIDAAIAGDEGREVRQLHCVDRQGRIAAWTGRHC